MSNPLTDRFGVRRAGNPKLPGQFDLFTVATIASVSRDPAHWGQSGQEDVFPRGTTLESRPYRAPNAEWDHDHCIFCWAKLMEPTSSDASRKAVENDPEILTSGYTAGPDGGEWVCPRCFDEFAERFGWKSRTD